MKIGNYNERHNFCWNDLLTKSNRTEIQTSKVEERTFGTPCIRRGTGMSTICQKINLNHLPQCMKAQTAPSFHVNTDK